MDALQPLVIAAHHRRLDPGLHLLLGHRPGQAHHLGPARDHAIGHPAHHLRCGEVDRSDPAAAETVERHARAGDIVTGIERGHPAHVAALHAVLRRDRPDDVVDGGGVEVVALADRLECGRGEMLRVLFGERTLALLADPARSADGVDDIGFGHGGILVRAVGNQVDASVNLVQQGGKISCKLKLERRACPKQSRPKTS